ncbi:hypothetical protein C2U70_01665 [Bradyrhizobium guangdongense]|nr:hypothetical protein C2U70_01665 [Bradyrhizobium guangdongense]
MTEVRPVIWPRFYVAVQIRLDRAERGGRILPSSARLASFDARLVEGHRHLLVAIAYRNGAGGVLWARTPLGRDITEFALGL